VAVAHRVYAQSLLDAATGKGRLARVRAELGEFVAAVGASRELRALIRNPQIDSRAKGAALVAVLAEADELVRNFVRLLVDKGRIDQIEDVHEEFERLIAREERVLKLELTTAVELSEAEAEEIRKKIEEASGRRVEAVRSVDPSLIGGVVVQAGSLRVDASVRGRLNKLRRELVTRSQ
jgi:F-type H+-transporting ATPase subunit delta